MAYRAHRPGYMCDLTYMCRYFSLNVHVIIMARRFDLDYASGWHESRTSLHGFDHESAEKLVEWFIKYA